MFMVSIFTGIEWKVLFNRMYFYVISYCDSESWYCVYVFIYGFNSFVTYTCFYLEVITVVSLEIPVKPKSIDCMILFTLLVAMSSRVEPLYFFRTLLLSTFTFIIITFR